MTTYHFWDQKNQSIRFNSVKALRQAIKVEYGDIAIEKIEHTLYTKKLCSQWKIYYAISSISATGNKSTHHDRFYIEVRQSITLQEEKPTLFHSLENLLAIYNSVVTHPYELHIKNGEYFLVPYSMLPIAIGKNSWDAKETLIAKIQDRQYCLGIEAIG